MPGIVDCALSMLPAHAAWGKRWMERHGGKIGRVRLHAVWLADPQAPPDAHVPVQALQDAQLALLRHDAGLLLVNYRTLGWTRTALAAVPAADRAPMLALIDDLQAPAVQDLLHLGLEDFLRDPCALDDVRARIERQAARGRTWAVAPAAGRASAAAADGCIGAKASRAGASGRAEPGGADAGRPASSHRLALPPSIASAGDGNFASAGDGSCAPSPVSPFSSAATAASAAVAESRESAPAFRASAFASRASACGVREPLLQPIPAASAFRADEPFRQAKSRIVASFERDYISRALARHAGNIAMAARAARKHRRAFWALMRKHGIEAGPYREAARIGLAAPPDGGCRTGR